MWARLRRWEFELGADVGVAPSVRSLVPPQAVSVTTIASAVNALLALANSDLCSLKCVPVLAQRPSKKTAPVPGLNF